MIMVPREPLLHIVDILMRTISIMMHLVVVAGYHAWYTTTLPPYILIR
jgi:hypothetical protein